jgi:hypothetical protein
MRYELCPGYFSRDDQRIIDREGPNSAKFYCALCNRQMKPVLKDGGWVPKNHEAVTMWIRSAKGLEQPSPVRHKVN